MSSSSLMMIVFCHCSVHCAADGQFTPWRSTVRNKTFVLVYQVVQVSLVKVFGPEQLDQNNH